MESLAKAFYSHPAFLPHRLLRAIGLAKFWVRNTIFAIFCITLLTVCVWRDHSFFIRNGYGYLQHPGIFGWYLVQLVMPVSIYAILKASARSRNHYRGLIKGNSLFNFRGRIFDPMVAFVGFRTPISRSFFALLFLIGFAAFAWNTFQNLLPGKLAPLDFWDSIHYAFGYFGTRAYKFYLDALLLPSVIHIFGGIVWTNIAALRFLSKQDKLRLALFNPDKCGGFGFSADIILSPAISALLVSGLAFFGVVYTHRSFDISTITGILIQAAIFIVFYVVPTLVLRSVLIQVKKVAGKEIHQRQEEYFESIMSGRLHGTDLRDAHEYLQYFNEISAALDKIPNWPHLARVSSAFGISISPALISSLVSAANALMKVYPKLHPGLP